MTSQKVTVVKAADGTLTATREDAVFGDMFTTLISSDQALTGVMGLGQKAALLVTGMAIQEYRRSGSVKFL